jgi:hypothetical protein
LKVGLIDVDSHNFPNLVLMKLSAYHKKNRDAVEWVNPLFGRYDLVYKAKVFDFTPDFDTAIQADEIVSAGTGYDLKTELPQYIENFYPDYSLYGISDTAYGFLTRGCPRGCKFCVVGEKEGYVSRQVADLNDFWSYQKVIKLLDPNLLACENHIKLLQKLMKSKAWVDFTQGLDARLMTKDIANLLNGIKIKEVHFAWDDMKQTGAVLKGLKIYAAHAKRKPHGFYGSVYVLTNFNTTHDQDLERVYKLREMNYDPYIMIYNKQQAPRKTRLLQRWVNNKIIFKSCKKFEDYNSKLG